MVVVVDQSLKLGRARRRRPMSAQERRDARKHYVRVMNLRRAMEGEQTRKKAPITLPKLKFMED